MSLLKRVLWTPEEYKQRPIDYDPALAQRIIRRIENGESLNEICFDRDMPLRATFIRWTMNEPQLAEDYEVALRIRVELGFDEILDAANGADPAKSRNQMEARKLQAERLMPKKYGHRAYQFVGDPEKDAAGVDYSASVRQKLDAMASRLRQTTEQPPEATDEAS